MAKRRQHAGVHRRIPKKISQPRAGNGGSSIANAVAVITLEYESNAEPAWSGTMRSRHCCSRERRSSPTRPTMRSLMKNMTRLAMAIRRRTRRWPERSPTPAGRHRTPLTRRRSKRQARSRLPAPKTSVSTPSASTDFQGGVRRVSMAVISPTSAPLVGQPRTGCSACTTPTPHRRGNNRESPDERVVSASCCIALSGSDEPAEVRDEPLVLVRRVSRAHGLDQQVVELR